ALRNELEVLHLIVHRNKNQHRQAKWWKYVSIVHRNLKNLVSVPQKRQKEEAKFEKEVVRYLVYRVIPKAFKAFHRLIAHGQYVTLGLVLLATVARIWSILRQ
ncbi:hypothetical protein LIPSTDRAFT_41460, partial [Lipomyces starkeyi NRRL Y-11557]